MVQLKSMKFAAAILCLSASGVAAISGNADVREIIRNASRMVGREIRLSSAVCAREPEGKYVCKVGKDRDEIRIESLGLNFKTTDAVRRLIVARCSSRLERVDRNCMFDVELRIGGVRTISTRSLPGPNVVITARSLNIFKQAPP